MNLVLEFPMDAKPLKIMVGATKWWYLLNQVVVLGIVILETSFRYFEHMGILRLKCKYREI